MILLLLSSPFLLYFLLWLLFARGLPSAESLLHYEPALPTYVRDINGEPVQSFARERRVQLAYDEFPARLINAFLAAEDRTFFSHGGLDYPGLVGAVWDYVAKTGSGERARGGSTITQQVAKIFFVGDEYSITRKIREAFLARRIESTLTKEQILELYLNQIFLGRNAYGVQAAARAYFNKDVGQLTLAECAFLAILPKSPVQLRSGPPSGSGAASGAISCWARCSATTSSPRPSMTRRSRQPLATVRGSQDIVRNVGGYFMEEVRRDLIARYGEKRRRGPNSVYAGGLWVRTSYDPRMQQAAETALRDGLRRYESGRGWRDPGPQHRHQTATGARSSRSRPLGRAIRPGARRWCFRATPGSITLGFTDGSRGTLYPSGAAMPKRGTATAAFDALRPGAVIAVEREGEQRWGAALDPGGFGRHGGRGGGVGPDPRHAGRLRRARLAASTAPPRRCASRARPSSRSSIPPRSTTA